MFFYAKKQIKNTVQFISLSLKKTLNQRIVFEFVFVFFYFDLEISFIFYLKHFYSIIGFNG